MATKSILKTVNINNRKLSRSFVNALEKSQKISSKPVQMSKPCKDVKKENVKDFFGL